MNDPVIREAKRKDATVVVSFIHLMVREMESMGGHEVRKSETVWHSFVGSIEERIVDSSCLYLLAEDLGQSPDPVGFLEATIVTIGGTFEEKKSLHIRSVYVPLEQRRKGIATQLVGNAISWGRTLGCVEADLNSLKGNPAQHLYRKTGFSVFEYSMRKRLD